MNNILRFLLFIILIGCQNAPINFEIDIINENGIIGEYLHKIENEANPILILLPGSGKPLLDTEELAGIVEDGYDIISLAYFGKRPLPKRIAEVPIEYIESAINWTRGQIQEKRKIILVGISKGAELALLYSSIYDNIDGLICYAPSILVLPDHVGADDQQAFVSSWTYKNQPVEFAEIDRFVDDAGEVVYKKYITPLVDQLSAQTKGKINVGNIKCPVLLLSGKSDLVWPAYEMSEAITRELKNKNSRVRITSVGYEAAGHQIFWFGKGQPDRISTSQSVRLSGIKKHRFIYGGTEEGTKNAMTASRKEVLRFLENIE